MGRVFIESMEDSSVKCVCRLCDTHLSDLHYLKNFQIETVEGHCVTFINVINYTTQTDCTIGQFHKSEHLYMYNCDSPLQCNHSGQCHKIYCTHCFSFLGWKHSNSASETLYIILKKVFH